MVATRQLIETVRRSAPGRAVTEATRWGFRTGGAATAGFRPPPDFLVIGSKRGGTTSLWRYLQEHPGILPLFPAGEHLKGLYYFDEGYGRGERWYLSHFVTARHRHAVARRLGYQPVTGEATPYYLFHPLAPARARDLVPDALIIAVLRDPVERAFSHWKERRNHTEELSFADALAAEPDRTEGEEQRLIDDPSYVSFAHRHQTYLAQGRYSGMIRRWREHFPAEQVLVVAAEEFYADPQAFVDDVTTRLHLPSRLLPTTEPYNAEPSKDMDPDLRDRLTAELAPDVRALEDLLGRPMPWSCSESFSP